jgi:hypothetical protein
MKEEHHNSEPPGEEDPSAKMMDWTGKKYRNFMDYVAFRDDDPTWMLAYKLVLRLFGILFIIILSPFLLLGLALAFMAAL